MLRLVLLLAAFVPVAACASGIDALKALLEQTTTARADFAQLVLDRNMKMLQRATGTMLFSRPGKFRWEYDKPNEQLIVSDGARVWHYDKDLGQVTVRRLDRALGSSPAALLAGGSDIEKSYSLTGLGSRDGLDWLEAVPRTQDTAFERIRLGFGASGLEAMELRDQFGQVTVIKFSTLERIPKLSADAFRFAPQPGVDVISE